MQAMSEEQAFADAEATEYIDFAGALEQTDLQNARREKAVKFLDNTDNGDQETHRLIELLQGHIPELGLDEAEQLFWHWFGLPHWSDREHGKDWEDTMYDPIAIALHEELEDIPF